MACQLAEEAGVEVEGEKRIFGELHGLLSSLKLRQTKPLLSWCAMNPEVDLKLAFQLHSIDYLVTLLEHGAMAAIALARATFPPFSQLFSRDISLLMGCLAYGNSLDHSPYADLHPRYIWEDVESSLIEAYCRLRQLPRQSALEQTIQVGTYALPKISKVVGLVKDRKVVGWSQDDELPVLKLHFFVIRWKLSYHVPCIIIHCSFVPSSVHPPIPKTLR